MPLNDVVIFRNLEALPRIRHLISKRDVTAPLDFSLALHTGQEPESILANRSTLQSRFGEKSLFFTVLQVHGDTVHIVEEAEGEFWRKADGSIRADALLTDLPNVVLTILTADCVPILLYDPGRQVIGAVHAGWRGTEKRIVAKTVARMAERYGSNPGEIVAAIGPAIGSCCYEVGKEVADAFGGYPEALELRNGKSYLDLKTVNRRQLIESGLREEVIETSSHCTSCERESFFSYRGEGGCDGRFASCIMLIELSENPVTPDLIRNPEPQKSRES